MNETSMQTTEEKDKRPIRKRAVKDETGSYLTWGIFLVLAGLALFAKEMGWLTLRLGWLLPAILVSIGCGCLYEVFKRKKE